MSQKSIVYLDEVLSMISLLTLSVICETVNLLMFHTPLIFILTGPGPCCLDSDEKPSATLYAYIS